MSERGSKDFYAGSRLLSPLVEIIGLPIDQVNFLICQLVALVIGILFRKTLDPRKTSPEVRHLVELLIGAALGLFCFGYQICHLLSQSLICYMIMKYGDRKWMHTAVFIAAMLYMSVAHIFRMYHDYYGYSLDITGPLMIATQKLTSVAYSVHDGLYKDEKDLNTIQKRYAIKKFPSLLEFFSYIFCFHGLMCGPLAFYSDYIAFINGTNYQVKKPDGTVSDEVPSPTVVVIKKFVACLILGALMLSQSAIAPWEKLMDDEFLGNPSIVWKMYYLLAATSMHRPRYYFAWRLGETINVATGLGFSGYDKDGTSKWDLIDNVQIWNLETSTSLKVNIESWNCMTAQWLRQVVYERAPASIRTLSVFIISAIWHGFYPGYYLTFATGALFTFAARLVRRNVRPYFVNDPRAKFFYDCVTFIFTRLANCLIVFSFMVLSLNDCLRVYASVYYWLHILAIAVFILFNFVIPPKKEKGDKAN